MEQFFTKIFEFFSSPEFTAAMTSILAAWTMIYPIINKVLKVKADSKLARVTAQLSTKTAEFTALQEQLLGLSQMTDSMVATVKELKSNSKNQNEAMLTAFSSSNLKQDVKAYIGKILEAKETVEYTIKDATAQATPPKRTEDKPDEDTEKAEPTIEYERVS